MGLKTIFLVVDHIPVEIFLLVNYFFDAAHTSNKIFLKDRQIFVTKWLLFLFSSIKHQQTLK